MVRLSAYMPIIILDTDVSLEPFRDRAPRDTSPALISSGEARSGLLREVKKLVKFCIYFQGAKCESAHSVQIPSQGN